MRIGRIRQAGGVGGYYHVMSRVADGRFLFSTCDPRAQGAVEADKFTELMWKLARFHEVEIFTWVLMSNHFHILLREPAKRRSEISDAELVRKVRDLNGESAATELEWRLGHYRDELRAPELAEQLKARFLARMGDVSHFVKELKGRFAQWYNRRHRRYGVLWAERFKSVLVEGDGEVLLTMAAYIDLNPVRAGLVGDPADYRYCGYGRAVAGGDRQARLGLIAALDPTGDLGSRAAVDSKVLRRAWPEFQQRYRGLLFGVIEVSEGTVAAGDSPLVDRGLSEGRGSRSAAPTLGLPELLRKRVRHFSAGLVIGGRAFVEEVFAANRSKFGSRRKGAHREIRAYDPGGAAAGLRSEWGGLVAMRDLRREVAG